MNYNHSFTCPFHMDSELFEETNCLLFLLVLEQCQTVGIQYISVEVV